MEANQLSIVIPCKNEELYIGKALRSIQIQSIVNPATPIYIADGESSDNTLQVINSFRNKLNISIIMGGLPPKGRNKGAELCNSKYILFMDSDIELANSNTLEKALEAAEANKLDLVIPQIRIKQANAFDKVFEYSYYLAARYKILGSFGTGMFMLFKSATFKSLGGFNEQLPLGDDWELSNQVKPENFALADTFIYTSRRRFVAQGYLHTFYQWVSVALNKNYRKKGHAEYFRMQQPFAERAEISNKLHDNTV